MAKASSANLGSWPEAVSVAVVTSDGGRISSKASALRSRASWHSARPIVAPSPRVIVNIDPLILIARSLSRMPRAAPVSQCGTRWCSGNSPGRPIGPWTTGLSAVGVAVGGVRVGQVGDAEQDVAQLGRHGVVLVGEPPLPFAERPALAAERVGAAPRRPSRRSWPTCLDSSLTWARASSRSAVISRSRSSSLAAALELVEQLRPAAPRHRRERGVEVGAQQADVDHRAATLPALW